MSSLRKSLNPGTENYEKNLLNYVADLQIGQNALESRVRMLEANQDSDSRRATSMKILRFLKFEYNVSINDTTVCANSHYTMDQAA